MIPAVTEYIKVLCVFIIFMSFAKIMIPAKYKDYVNLALGFVLIFLMISPLTSLKGGKGLGNMIDAAFSVERNIIRSQASAYDKVHTDAVLTEYKARLGDKLRSLAGDNGFSLILYEFDVIEEGEDFGEITGVSLQVTQGEDGQNKAKRPIIRIERPNFEPIRINAGKESAEPESDDDQESCKINSLKKIISDFYNLPIDNIYIKEIS